MRFRLSRLFIVLVIIGIAIGTDYTDQGLPPTAIPNGAGS